MWYGCVDSKATDERKCDDDEPKPAERRQVAAFSIMQTEVTAHAYAACVEDRGCDAKDHRTGDDCTFGVSGKGTHPMNCVSWHGAAAYCRWWGKTFADGRGRLPTEEEFEQAARGDKKQTYSWGNDRYATLGAANRKVANIADAQTSFDWREKAYDDGFATTAPVKSFEAGPFGVHDLIGNVWEWQWSCYYPASMRPKNNAPCQRR